MIKNTNLIVLVMVTMMVMVMVVGNGGMQRVTGVTITRDWLTHGSCGALEIEGSSSTFALTDQHIFYIQGGFFSFVPGFTGIQRLGLDDGGKDVSMKLQRLVATKTTLASISLTFDAEEDGDGVSAVLVLHHQRVRPAVPQANAPHGEPADVAVGHMGVLHQLGLVLAVQLTAGRQDSASPLPGVLQRKG